MSITYNTWKLRALIADGGYTHFKVTCGDSVAERPFSQETTRYLLKMGIPFVVAARDGYVLWHS